MSRPAIGHCYDDWRRANHYWRHGFIQCMNSSDAAPRQTRMSPVKNVFLFLALIFCNLVQKLGFD